MCQNDRKSTKSAESVRAFVTTLVIVTSVAGTAALLIWMMASNDCRRRCDPISALGIGSPGLICEILRLGCTHKFKNPWIPWIFWSKPLYGGPNAFFRSTESLSISTEWLVFSTEWLIFSTGPFFAVLRYSSSFFNKNKEKEKKGRG